MKRSVCMLLVVFLLMTMLPMVNAAGDIASGYCGGEGDGSNLSWELDNNGTLHIAGYGDMQNYKTGGSPPWYFKCASIKKVIIGVGVTSIGSWAFNDCRNLTFIEIPDSVTSIGEYAFGFCTQLASVSIPDSVTIIDDGAFCGCDMLTSVAIPDSVTIIGDTAFHSCDRLAVINIGNCVTSIGKNAFSYCNSLVSVTIPDSVTVIGHGAFHSCESLRSVEVDAGNQNYSDENGVLFNKGRTALYCYPAGKAETFYAIPSGVTTIDDTAFIRCKNLISVTIPDGVTSIGDGVFFQCENLGTVRMSNSVTTIGKEAFYHCKKLTSVLLSENIKTIGEAAFQECSGLNSVIIPDSVTSIESGAFKNCSGLTSVYFEGNAPSVSEASSYSPSFHLGAVIYYSLGTLGWTDSEVYDAASRTWNGYKLAVWNDTPNKPEKPMQPNEPETPQEPTQPEEDITAGFLLGRDNNNFVHSAGFQGIKRYELSSERYWRLASYLAPAQRLALAIHMSTSKWEGSCHGVSSTMLLAHMDELDLSDLAKGVEYYYDMPLPYKNEEFLDYIQFYQLGQAAVDSVKGEGSQIPQVLNEMLVALDEAPVIFSFGWEAGGHSVIALDHSLEANGDHKVCLYDLNSFDGNEGSYTILSISADFQNYSFYSTGYYLDQSNLNYVEFTTVDDLMEIDPDKNNKKSNEDIGECVQFRFFASQDEFVVENEERKTLKYEDGKFSGTMKIKDLDLTCYGTANESLWTVTVAESDEFVLTDCDGDVMMGLFTDEGCVALKTEKVKEVKFVPNEKIEIEADKKEYEMTAWMSNDMVDDDEIQIIQVEAEMQGDATVEIDDKQVTVKADKIDTGSLSLIDGMDEEKLKDLDDTDDTITVSVSNKKENKKDDKDVEMPFRDVAEEDWFYDAVAYVYDEELMNGTTEDTFSPDMTITRGMIVTILHRLEGEPTANAAVFTDVRADDYYAEAVAWAAENGIVTGYGNGIFAPDTPITREQLATILHRYAEYRSCDTANRDDLSKFADAGAVSSYALDSVQWAVEVGLINGVEADVLQPGGTATRAQAAAILMRLCEEVIN